MRVMQAKYNSRVKLQQINSRNTTNGGPFALNYVGRGINQGCCANIPKAPSRQQSYGLYLKRATMGIGGVASKVVGEKFTDPSFNRGEQQATLTYKRPQEFTTGNYINNKKSTALRCEYTSKFTYTQENYGGNDGWEDSDAGHCEVKPDPICNNNCGKNITITQDLGYISAGQQIDKKKALRAGNWKTTILLAPASAKNQRIQNLTPFESAIMTNGSCETTVN